MRRLKQYYCPGRAISFAVNLEKVCSRHGTFAERHFSVYNFVSLSQLAGPVPGQPGRWNGDYRWMGLFGAEGSLNRALYRGVS